MNTQSSADQTELARVVVKQERTAVNAKPFVVYVDGQLLKDARGCGRRFAHDTHARIAGFRALSSVIHSRIRCGTTQASVTN